MDDRNFLLMLVGCPSKLLGTAEQRRVRQIAERVASKVKPRMPIKQRLSWEFASDMVAECSYHFNKMTEAGSLVEARLAKGDHQGSIAPMQAIRYDFNALAGVVGRLLKALDYRPTLKPLQFINLYRNKHAAHRSIDDPRLNCKNESELTREDNAFFLSADTLGWNIEGGCYLDFRMVDGSIDRVFPITIAKDALAEIRLAVDRIVLKPKP